jgi:hypothetical protein
MALMIIPFQVGLFRAIAIRPFTTNTMMANNNVAINKDSILLFTLDEVVVHSGVEECLGLGD